MSFKTTPFACLPHATRVTRILQQMDRKNIIKISKPKLLTIKGHTGQFTYISIHIYVHINVYRYARKVFFKTNVWD